MFNSDRNFIISDMGPQAIQTEEEEDWHGQTTHIDPNNVEQQTHQSWKIIKHHNIRYVVGEAITPGTGPKDQLKHTHDPNICQHPSDQMMARGGNGQSWWTCAACGSRWDRILLSTFGQKGDVPQDRDT